MTTLSITRYHGEQEVDIFFAVTSWGYDPTHDDPGAPPEVEIESMRVDDAPASVDQFERLVPWAEQFFPDMVSFAIEVENDMREAEAEFRADLRSER